ncbi:SPOSA6832_04442 [Sporobolomyces salmonicolor]|uniref:SPOSA6832_04442-mRNA-1:cds n=1 Tax=Sporidiobolus salmonicolor TaxID=5005 RepID=A0A0D6ES02_SPOSA|nr:SPOSA6832_04442 [Sporobolomyces salmonicolor]
MEAYVTAAAELVLAKLKAVPGSGKSTLAYPLVDRLNALLGVYVKEPAEVDLEDVVAAPGKEKSEDEVAIAVGLDGWHHTRGPLRLYVLVRSVIAGRSWCVISCSITTPSKLGAAFTFDTHAYVSFIRSLRSDPVFRASSTRLVRSVDMGVLVRRAGIRPK